MIILPIGTQCKGLLCSLGEMLAEYKGSRSSSSGEHSGKWIIHKYLKKCNKLHSCRTKRVQLLLWAISHSHVRIYAFVFTHPTLISLHSNICIDEDIMTSPVVFIAFNSAPAVFHIHSVYCNDSKQYTLRYVFFSINDFINRCQEWSHYRNLLYIDNNHCIAIDSFANMKSH